MKSPIALLLAGLAIAGCSRTPEPAPNAAADATREAARLAIDRYVIDFGIKGDTTAIEQAMTDPFVWHVNGHTISATYANHREIWRPFRKSFPDLTGSVDLFTFGGDVGAAALTTTGTYAGGICDTPATGLRPVWTTYYLFRVVDGRIAELWETWDSEGMKRGAGIDLSKC